MNILDAQEAVAIHNGFYSLQEMALFLSAAMQDPDIFKGAEMIYSTMYRGEPLRATEMFEDEDQFNECMGYFPIEPYAQDTLVCELCNYKGEGEGFGFYSEVKDYPVYKER